jgi:uncharacterized protein YjaZ
LFTFIFLKIKENKTKEQQTITEGKLNQCIFISNCTDCQYTVKPSKISKIVIEKCKNTIIYVDTILITSIIEFISCSNVDVEFMYQQNSPDLTIQMDKSNDVFIFGKIYIFLGEISNQRKGNAKYSHDFIF